MAVTQDKLVAFCTPVMNRMEDLKRTLGHNLETLKPFGSQVQLIIGCFDQTKECEDWVHTAFPEFLEAGILRFEPFTPLPYWHFSWAKNAFTHCISAQYYSSLDGDNFLSQDEVKKLLDLLNDTEQHYLIHHFSGNWGDGTSGRITLPVTIYREAPYLNEILPRQFDETGVILKLLTNYPDLAFVSRQGIDIFDKSGWCRDYIELNGLTVNRKEVDLGPVITPVNPKGENYVGGSEKLFYFHHINASYTLWRLSPLKQAKEEFQARLEGAQRAFAKTNACYENLSTIFARAGLSQLRRTAETTLYAVNRNNYTFLWPWIKHYRSLGVKRFIIVDDGSDYPLDDWLEGEDIFVVRPIYGSFRTSKVFWLRVLMGAFQEAGSWVLTADVDEFLDIAPSQKDKANLSLLDSLIARADSSGIRQIPGLLLDMMPDPENGEVSKENFLQVMDWYFLRPPSKDLGYHTLHPVRWAFGDYWHVPLSVDIRYRLYGTIDCLRKIPVFRFDNGIYLNQGFHNLWRNEIALTWKELLEPTQGLLPIRHYKLAKVFWSPKESNEIFERREQYFDRTQQNFQRIEQADFSYIWRSWKATPFKSRYSAPEHFPYYFSLQNFMA